MISGNKKPRSGSWSQDFLILENNNYTNNINNTNTGKNKNTQHIHHDKKHLQKKVSVFFKNVLHTESPHSNLPVLSCDVPFNDLRDLGTLISRININSTSVVKEEIERMIEMRTCRRVLKQVLIEIVKRAAAEFTSFSNISSSTTSTTSSNHGKVLYVMLYSALDDRYDMLSYHTHIVKIFSTTSSLSSNNTNTNTNTSSINNSSSASTLPSSPHQSNGLIITNNQQHQQVSIITSNKKGKGKNINSIR